MLLLLALRTITDASYHMTPVIQAEFVKSGEPDQSTHDLAHGTLA